MDSGDLADFPDVTDTLPLVTILIATKDRPGELRLTLTLMREQGYPATEMLVIDDGSKDPVAPAVRELWPEAIVIRCESNGGQCLRRNEGFALAKGKYILQLDDDCSFIDRTDLANAVMVLQNNAQAGALSFYVVNALALPNKIDTSRLSAGCVPSFMGAAVLFRKAALDQTAGYRSFFGNEWEEEELGLQLLSRNWRIIFIPQIIVHHRLSPLNRNSSRTWMRGLRNRTWAMIMHMPAPRVFFELGWKVTLGAWDAIRLMRKRLFLQAMCDAVAGVPAAWLHRHPLSDAALRRYDQLRLHAIITEEQFGDPAEVNWKSLRGFWRRWRNRARNRNVWDREPGDIGGSYTVAYAHEEHLQRQRRVADGRLAK